MLQCSGHWQLVVIYWQLVVICPKDNVVAWFCSLHNKPNNQIKGIVNKLVLVCNTITLSLVFDFNILIDIIQYQCMFFLTSALKGFNDKYESKSKVNAKWISVKVI